MRQLHEPGELLMIEGRVRPDDTDRRPETRGGATDIVPDHVVHLKETFFFLAARPPDRPILERVVDVANAVRHDDGSDVQGPTFAELLPSPPLVPPFVPKKGPTVAPVPPPTFPSETGFVEAFRQAV